MPKLAFLRTQPLSGQDRILFVRQLSTFLKAGIPILEAVALIEETSAKRARSHFARVRLDLTEGRPLAQACAGEHHLFDAFGIALIRIGEESGGLHESLARLASTVERQERLRRTIIGALAYPALIAAATVGIAGFLAGFAFPKIVPLFRGFSSTLPWPTRVLMTLSDALSRYGLALLILLLVAIPALTLLLRRERVQYACARMLLEIPILGPLFEARDLAAIASALATLLGSGARIVPAIERAAEVARLLPYRDSLRLAATLVAGGERLSKGLAASRQHYPLPFMQMVAAGERTGILPGAFAFLAEAHEAELDHRAQALGAMIEPALMVVMGLVVGFIALAIILPVYQITQDLPVH
jgi:type II secretory pathway component PulF